MEGSEASVIAYLQLGFNCSSVQYSSISPIHASVDKSAVNKYSNDAAKQTPLHIAARYAQK